MNLQEKLEEIKKKPEHIRERYLWIALGISMLLIFITWIISVKAAFQVDSNENSNFNITNAINDAKRSVQEGASQDKPAE